MRKPASRVERDAGFCVGLIDLWLTRPACCGTPTGPLGGPRGDNVHLLAAINRKAGEGSMVITTSASSTSFACGTMSGDERVRL